MVESHAPLSLGTYLRELRQSGPGTLEEMARATRIGVRQLEALECEAFDELPAPVFVKGFIQAYCQFLGVPADEALRRYREALGEPPASDRASAPPPRTPSWSASPLLISLALLVVFGAGLLAFTVSGRRDALPPAAVAPAVPPVAPAERATVPVDAAPVAAERAPDPPAAVEQVPATIVTPRAVEGAGEQHLVVRATEPTWIRVKIGDSRTVEELLEPGASREWTSATRFLLTVGNAGGIEVELNGRPIPALGPRGAVIRGLELPPAAASSGS